MRIWRSGAYRLQSRNDAFALNARLQYATQINDREYPSLGVRFANGTLPDQRIANIWGSRIGREYLNLGFGANWKLNEQGDNLFYINYDAKWYQRATLHVGEAGFIKKW